MLRPIAKLGVGWCCTTYVEARLIPGPELGRDEAVRGVTPGQVSARPELGKPIAPLTIEKASDIFLRDLVNRVPFGYLGL